MITRRTLTSAALIGVAAASLAACSTAPAAAPSDAATPAPSASANAVPTFDPAQDWYGMTSPVLLWDQDERDAFTESIAHTVSAAQKDRGITGDENPVMIAAALEDVMPRPARELLLLDAIEFDAADGGYLTTLESIVLDKAWETCLDLEAGASYAELVDSVAAAGNLTVDSLDEPVGDVGRANAIGTVYAPIVCPAFADEAITWMDGAAS